VTDGNQFDPDLYDDAQEFVVEYGRDVLNLLDPSADERILDLGCGTGHLTAEIAEQCSDVVGIDASPAMIEQASESYPDVEFRHADATTFRTEEPFDAVFSNAALHWIDDQDAVLAAVASALEPGGRFVAEMGTSGNVGPIIDAVLAEGERRDIKVQSPWYFPSLGEYATRLEAHEFEIQLARTFERETQLDGEDGLAEWLEQFGDDFLGAFPNEEREEVVEGVVERLRSDHYHADRDCWTVPYRRLQFVAVAAE